MSRAKQQPIVRKEELAVWLFDAYQKYIPNTERLDMIDWLSLLDMLPKHAAKRLFGAKE